MSTSARQPLSGRSSLGNTQRISSSSSTASHGSLTRRRSSFISKGSGIEIIIPNEELDTWAQENTPVYPKRKDLAKKNSLNALSVGRTRTATPRPRVSASSFAERIAQEELDISFVRPSDTMDGNQDIAIDVGDSVQVPGGMTGTVKFLGVVRGKKGVFAGVELDKEFAPRGKNDGDVDGTKYFSTTVPGAGIFLPAHRAMKNSSPASTTGNFPPTPTTPSFTASLNLNKGARDSSASPQTPSIPKFGRSVTGASSRPNFSQSVGPGVVRAPSPQLRKPASRPSLPRPESPQRKPTAPNKFSQSLRGGRPPGVTPDAKTTLPATKTPGTARSPSRNTHSRNHDRSPDANPARTTTTTTNGTTPTPKPRAAPPDDLPRLHAELSARDHQLQTQAAALAEMESSLTELQSLVAASAQPSRSSTTTSLDDADLPTDVTQLRAQIREKTTRISALTAEFDAHRADFRSTIDTLEMASTETERVYEKRVEELLRENEELSRASGGSTEVEAIATQLKSLESLVAELEDGLEDARRGEAEARSEVEFLRGEVERGRTELRREREMAVGGRAGGGGGGSDARDDEIRGLKAIIHSLSSNTTTTTTTATTNGGTGDELDALRRERSELRGLVERKTFREEELERELAALKRTSADAPRRSHADSAASAKTAIRPGSARAGELPDFPPPPAPAPRNSGGGLVPAQSERPGTSHSQTFEDASEEPAVAPLRVERKEREEEGLGMSALTGEGPAAGKTSGVVDMGRWCALCERDGHESVDCPFEEF